MARLRGDPHQPAAACIGGDDLAQAAVGPAHEGDALPVARPRGKRFDRIPLHEPPGCAARGVAQPQVAEAFVHHRPPVGRERGHLDHLRFEAVGRDRDLRVRGVGDPARIVDAEGNVGQVAAVGIDALQLAAGPEHQAAAVGRPVEVGIDPVNRPGFLQVGVEIAVDLALDPAGEILDPQLRLVAVAADEGDRLAVGRRRRAHRPAVAGDRGERFAGFQIVLLDLEIALQRILRVDESPARAGVLGEVDRLAVGREDRLALFLLERFVRPRDKLDPAAPRHAVEPYLAGARRTRGGEVLLGDDGAPVGAPVGLVEQAEVFLGHLHLAAAVGVHQPHVVAPAAVGGERDAAAVGREAWLDLPRQTFGDAGRRAAADRHRVDIAQQAEREAAPVGAHVDVEPRTFVGADRHLADHCAAGRVHVPLGVFLRGRGGGQRGGLDFLAGALRRLGIGGLRRLDLLLLDRVGRWRWRRSRVLRLRGGSDEQQREDGGDGMFHGGVSQMIELARGLRSPHPRVTPLFDE